jgi:fusion and transport protein UGO1
MYLHSELLYPTLLNCTLTPLIATCAPRYIAHLLSHRLARGSAASRRVRIEITEDTNPYLWALATLLGSCAGHFITIPVETIRRRLQVQTRGSALPLKTCVETRPKRYVGIVDALYSIITEERSDLPLKPSKKRKGKKHRRSMSTASEKGKQRETDVVAAEEDDANEGSWLRRSGVGQLYRGLGMRMISSLVVFVLEIVPTRIRIDDGWTEL